MFVVAICSFGTVVSAQTHANTYGSCEYSAQCASTTPGSDAGAQTSAGDPGQQNTVMTLASGLDVAVNLRNGQVLPRDGYTIIVTPLNGRGASFRDAAFFLDGTMRQQVTPDATGTVRWLFRPDAEQMGMTVKIVVSGQDQTSVTKEFDIRIAANTVPPGGPRSAASYSDVGEPAAVTYLRHVVAKVPTEVLRNFPYALFMLLGVDALILSLLALREVAERRAVSRALTQVNEIAEARKAYNQLVSHYLRTPLTLVDGGIDMLRSQGDVQQAELDQLNARVEGLKSCVALLIRRASETSSDMADPAALLPERARSSSMRLYVYTPVVCIGLLLVLANYLVSLSDTLTVTAVSLLLQVVVFGGMASALYFAYRMFALHRSAMLRAQILLHDWGRINDLREAFVVETARSLQGCVRDIMVSLQNVRPSPARKFADNGMRRFVELSEKCSIAATLRGARSGKPLVATPAREVIDHAKAGTAGKIAAKRATLKVSGGTTIRCRDPKLLAFVLGSLLDNAVEYGPEGAEVLIDVAVTRQATKIRVTNEGPTIPAEAIATLFEPFAKGEGAETFNHEGPGLSLYLDRLVLCYLGGTIAIVSKAGRTTVDVCLPLK